MREETEKCPRGFFLNAEKALRGMRMTVGGVIKVRAFSAERVVLLTHGCAVELVGRELSIGVFEGRAVEVSGRITEMRLIYGKN